MATTPAVVRFPYTNFHVENENKNNNGDQDEPAKEVGESLETETRQGEQKRQTCDYEVVSSLSVLFQGHH